MGDQVFSGLKVIECASFIAAPLAATILADYGADVIKVEAPGDGDTYRRLSGSPTFPQSDVNYAWIMAGRNKRSIALDLKTARGLDVLRRLVAEADVFVTNLPFAVRRKLGIGYEDLHQLNSKLIYASFTAYGERGAEAGRKGFDTTAYWARSGLMDMMRDAGAPPLRPIPGGGDHPSAVTLYAAIVTALYRRQTSGEGAHVSTSLLANGIWANGILVQAGLVGAAVNNRPPRPQSLSAMQNIYRTRDRRYFNLAMDNDVREFPILVRALGRPELATDERFATSESRMANVPDLLAVLDEAFGAFDLAELALIFEQTNITYGLVSTVDEARTDDQMRAAGVIVRTADNAFDVIDSPLQIAEAPKKRPGAAPSLGQHSIEVLREAGFADPEIEDMRQSGVVT